MEKNKAIVFLIVLLGVLFIVSGVSYAYFTAMATSNEQVVKSGALELTYHTGQDIQATNIIPSEEENASIHQFTVENTGTLDAHYNISFTDITFTKKEMDTFSDHLKWALYQADENYTEGSLVKMGSFSSSSGYLSGDNELVIKTNMILAPKEKQSYLLKVWLQETGELQNEEQGKELTMRIQVDTLEKQEMTSKQSIMKERTSIDSIETFYQYSKSITKIVFQNRMNPIETEFSWDVSKNNDGNCMAYLVSNQEATDPTYTLYVQGNDAIYLSNGSYLFTGFSNLRTIEGIEYINTSQVISMFRMFEDCENLINLDLSHFDTSQVIDMGYMFKNCSSLINLNLNNFDTSQVTSMAEMFLNCRQLTDLDLSHFDTSKVQSMRSMFYNCSSLASLDVSHFDTSQVTRIYQMFLNCSNLEYLNLSSFNLSQVDNMSSFFNGCSSLKYLDIRNATFTTVTSYSSMFYSVPSTIRVIVKDGDAQSWIQDKLGSGNGTVIIA